MIGDWAAGADRLPERAGTRKLPAVSGRLHLKFLGGFRACFESGQACHLPARKCEALLAYLALPCGRFHPRDRLAALLWGETPDAQARQSVRQALGSVRRALRDHVPGAILTHEDTVALNPQAVTVDVRDFEAALAEGGTAALERAAALYDGDFLAGLRVDEPPFEEWRVVERERLHELALEGLAKLLSEYVRSSRGEAAIQAALRLLAIDPLQEAVHRTLMRQQMSQGRRAAALQQYQACVSHLQRELGAEPDEESRQLYREILRAIGSGSASTGASNPTVPITRTRAAEAPLIGRQAELGRLREAARRMIDAGGGPVMLVTGEAGIGKSRLIDELVTDAMATGLGILVGRCHESEQILPLRPWIEALRSDGAALNAGTRAQLSVTARAQLVPLFPELQHPGDAPGASAQPGLLFDPLLELIGTLAAERPRVVILEDLHWADAMSARLLAFLGRRLTGRPALLVASMRPEELVEAPAIVQTLEELRRDGRVDEIALGPLEEAESRALVRALRPAPRVERAAARVRLEDEIWTLSEGNPFVIVESVRSLEHAVGAGPTPGLRMGRRVHDVVAARLMRLTELPRQCVAVAATIGRDFPFGLLARAAGVTEGEAAAAVEELVRRRVLDSVGDRLDFCHSWMRVVAYEGLLPPRRALLHAAVAGALEDLHEDRLAEVADQLGSHYLRAGDFRRAVRHLMEFGQVAAQRYALDDALRALEQAMAGVEQLPASERPRLRVQVALRRAFVLSIMGRQREILDLLGAHQDDLARAPDAELASEYYFRLGLSHFYLGEWLPAQLAGEQALRHGERVGDREAIGKALHVLSLQAWAMGRPGDGIAHATRAIPLLEPSGSLVWLGLAYHDLGLNCVLAGDLDAALAATKQEEAIGRAALFPRLQALAGYVAAWAHALRGATELAIETARRALSISADTTTAGLLSGTLGYAYLEQDDAVSAVPLLEEVVDQLKRSPVRSGQIRHMALLGEAYLLTGDRTHAHEIAAQALELAEIDGMPLNIAITQRALGRITRAGGDLEAAHRYLSAALQMFTRCGATLEVARTRLDLAAVRGARGDRDGAREHLVAALAVFDSANAPKRAAAARDLACSLAITLPGAAATARP